MEESKKVKNTTSNYPKKANERSTPSRRSDKYKKEELDEIKETVEIPVINFKDKQKDKEIVKNQEKVKENEKTKEKTIEKIKTESKSDKKEPISEQKEMKKEKNDFKERLNNILNKKKNNLKTVEHNHNNRPTQRPEVQPKKNGEEMPKKVIKKKKKKLDPNSLIFFGIVLFVAIIVFLKTMGTLMTCITIAGIALIIACSMFLKKIRKNKVVRVITNLFTILFLLACIAGVCGVGYFAYIIVSEAPQWNTKQLNEKETSLVYTNDGVLYAELGTEKREIITYDEASENLINAIIATEDSRFFTHNGFDPLRFFKAGVSQVLGNSDAGGASTLSMQVVKNTFTDASLASMDSGGIKRKFTDIYLSVFKLEKEYSKEAILEFYMNNHFLGSNSYGVEQASQTYFGKSAKDLTLAEATLIAGMFQAPTSYNPFLYPNAATERRAEVLNLMYTHGYITKEERDLANSIPIESLLAEVEDTEYTQYQSYIDTVIDELDEKYGLNPYNTSLKIYTNIDLEKQAGLDAIFKGETFDWENDVVQAGIAAVDVHTGKITAIAGSRKSDARVLNFAREVKRQIGSTAKPIFDYGPAIEYEGWSTYTIIKDEPYTYSTGQPLRNSDRKYKGNMTLKEALAQSRNVPALKAFQAVDKDNIYNFVTGLGITPDSPLHEAHAIGSFGGSNALEMAAAYAAFANGGLYYEPYTISKIVYRDTGETFDVKNEGTRVMSDSTAYMITNALEYTVTDGLAKGVAMKGIHLAAKTGTTNYTSEDAANYNLPSIAVPDAWIVGYDPDTAVGMWYGYEKTYKQTSNKASCSTEAYYLKSVSSGCKINVQTERNGLYKAAGKVLFTSNGKEFSVPDSVVKVAIEKGSNPAKLASSATPKNKITYEYFRKGTEPTEISPTYIKLSNVTNLTANYDFLTGNVKLTWTAAAPNVDFDETYGRFGYKIYLNDTYIGFTEDTQYTVRNQTDPIGTYKIITTYEDYSDTDSSGATVKLSESDTDNSTYHATNNFQTSYFIGDTISSCFTNGTVDNTCMSLYKDNQLVTDGYTITASVVDEFGTTTTIDPNIQGSYTVTFNIKYNGKNRVTKVVVITIN